jgi:DNA-binding XRE family transcriptional regulator
MELSVKQTRREKGITQEQATNDLGMKLRCYQGIERGEMKLTVEVAYLLADYFRVSIDELIGRPIIRPYVIGSADPQESQIVANYRKLNDDGRTRLFRYSAELVSHPHYSRFLERGSDGAMDAG